MGYHWTDAAELAFTEREAKPDEQAGRLVADLTPVVELKHSRARLWRYPAHTTGRRHRDHAQEEVFVVISGTMTMLLGDEPERVDVGPGSVVAVDPMTALQVRNESDAELVLFIYGTPPVSEGADMLDDVELPAPAA
jgi:mannose-6-phosphate isomerase-like protein (cupin superfamily)